MNDDIVDLEVYEPDGSHPIVIFCCKCQTNDTSSGIYVLKKICKSNEVPFGCHFVLQM